MKRKTIFLTWCAALLSGSLAAETLYDFRKGDCGWLARRNCTAELTPDGMKLVVKGTHPNLGIDAAKIVPAEAKYLLVDYKLTGSDGKDFGRLFFATAEEPRLAEDKKLVFRGLVPDGAWHTLVLHVQTHKKWREASAVTRLRLDFQEKGQGEFTVRSVRLVPTLPPVKCDGWRFENSDAGWTQRRNARAEKSAEGLKLTITGPDPNLGIAGLNLDPASCPALKVTYKATGFASLNHSRAFFATAKEPKMDERKKIYVGSLIPDGAWHTIVINPDKTAGGGALWFDGGAITNLRFDFTDQKQGEVVIRSIEPVVTPDSAWRMEMKQRGVPARVPVELGTTKREVRAAVFDKNQPFFESPMAAPAGRRTAPGSVLVRREFTLPEGAVQTALFQSVADDRVVRLLLNGEEVKHAWRSSWQRSDCVEVTKFLRPGKNVLALEYCNDGAVGGVMFDLSVLFRDGGFVNVTAAGSLAKLGKAPGNWADAEFDAAASGFASVELFPGPPNVPWTAAVPTYRDLRPVTGNARLEKVDCKDFSLTARFRVEPALKPGEILYAHLLRPDGSLIACRSGKVSEFAVRELADGQVEVDFGAFDLPRYGGAVDAALATGVYRRANTTALPARFTCPARPFPAPQIELKAVRTPAGPVPMLDGKPWYFNILTVNSPGIATGMEGNHSPFNVVAFRAGGLRQMWWIGPDQYDFTDVDRIINRFLENYPDSKIALYVWCQPGVWYEKLYPERISRQDNGAIMRYYTATVCFSDPGYRRDAARAVTAFVGHCEKTFGGRIALYNLMGGISCEWQGWNAHTAHLADYGAAARRDFAACLTRYAPGSDPRIPGLAERTRTAEGATLFRDPVRDQTGMLYDRYYSESIADCIAELAKAAKQACGGRKLVGAYYGYHMEYGNLGYCMSGGGHNALYRLLQSPDIDFILSPQSYGTRSVGSPNSDMKPFTSVAKYGKFCMLEDDTRTHCTGFDGFSHALNPGQTQSVLRRNLGMQLARRMPLNHLPLVGGSDLDDPAIRADFDKALAAGQQVLERALPRRTEVAAVIDEQSARLLAFSRKRGASFLPFMIRYDRAGNLLAPDLQVQLLTGELLYFQRIVLGQIGCPVDYILLEDAPEAAKRYKMLVLLDCFENTPLLRETFAAARQSGAHILSVYGSGFMTGKGADAGAMSELLGMKLVQAAPGTLQVKLGAKAVGGSYLFTPRFKADDPAAEALASYADGGGCAAARRGNVTFYAGAQLEAGFVREAARRAGAHIYLESGDNLEAGCGILSIHSTSRGKKSVALPAPARLTEIFTGETVDGSSGRAEFEMEALTTRVFRVDPCGK